MRSFRGSFRWRCHWYRWFHRLLDKGGVQDIITQQTGRRADRQIRLPGSPVILQTAGRGGGGGEDHRADHTGRQQQKEGHHQRGALLVFQFVHGRASFLRWVMEGCPVTARAWDRCRSCCCPGRMDRRRVCPPGPCCRKRGISASGTVGGAAAVRRFAHGGEGRVGIQRLGDVRGPAVDGVRGDAVVRQQLGQGFCRRCCAVGDRQGERLLIHPEGGGHPGVLLRQGCREWTG